LEYWYRYRDDLYKRITLNEYKESSYHERHEIPEQKLVSNIRRAARMIESYALCNPWDWFGTFTLNKKYRDRKDLDKFRESFMQLIRNSRRQFGDIEALLVPELHKDKDGWHIHGLLSGLPVDALRPFTLDEKLPKYIRDKLIKNEKVYDWPIYRNSFGFVDIEPIKNRDAAARYVSKYMAKNSQTVTAKSLQGGKHLYYVTRGLLQPEVIIKQENSGCIPESLPKNIIPGKSYEFEYGVVEWFEALNITNDIRR